ncbi:LacI family DNA-binding transcriptional regulator [Desmospora activa]|uniref:LacI family transcriptional regulator n=1 Tax=Desmospora activa DSM 45169 TaxID=1121389 RepID=A0A2T4ZBR3_9BACL|nr:LacI family DNA-binding transcriptional regulator [Desmospora activa]PTM59333.1 LacI family transcriptional regulator [Desmospora activa DSM 45169]
MASIKDIAQLAKVSPGTASVVLNGKGDQYRISATTQQRVLEAARMLDYRPNISARRLRSGGEKVVPILALFWTLDTRAPLIGRFLQGVHQGLQSLEEECELLIQPYVGAKLQEEKSLITGTRFNAAIIANATEEDERFLQVANLNVPIVLHLRESERYSAVTVDHASSGRQVARLFSSRGHQRVGLIVPKISSKAIRTRTEGFLDEARLLGMKVGSEHIAGGAFTEVGGYRAAEEIFHSGVRPTAIFALSDQMALGALSNCYEKGIVVPEEMEIVGHDNSESSQFTIPPLTTVHLPVEEMAASCVQMLVDLINHRVSAPVVKKFQTELVIRTSCGDFIDT